ncbi:MAG: 6-pyruvoyl tetrahydropterin synthase family protein, partial [Nitrospinales bacterium]
DFVELKRKVNEILAQLDYKNINEVPPFDKQNPSAENIARWLFQILKDDINSEMVKVKRVEIKEFEDCGASYFE